MKHRQMLSFTLRHHMTRLSLRELSRKVEALAFILSVLSSTSSSFSPLCSTFSDECERKPARVRVLLDAASFGAQQRGGAWYRCSPS